ncbi:EKC/KEOPS complex subunit TPRKB [Patella vulgata]|uniref:EKC/KEOPS complex subunit TPRKB n=1 Tax=Patella vulgata TaxID=6465 RepID=UPI00217F7608|nr:EKC/KEOPS complex subunit TPRKB [Patella vulgata]
MAAKVIVNELFPDSTITLALFRNVENVKEIRQCVMNGTFEAAILKTSMIVDPFQVIVAANKAVHQNKVGKMMTKNVHSEILFNLSPSKNISDSFRKFGAGDTDQSVFIAVVDDKTGQTLKAIQNTVKGQQVDVDEVKQLSDLNNIKKIYKLTDAEFSWSPLDALVTRIAAKDIMTI